MSRFDRKQKGKGSLQHAKAGTKPESVKRAIRRKKQMERQQSELRTLATDVNNPTKDFFGWFNKIFDAKTYCETLSDPNIGEQQKKKEYNQLMKKIKKGVIVNRYIKRFSVNVRGKRKIEAKADALADMWDVRLYSDDLGSTGVPVEHEWFVVKRSTIEGAGLGLFADRNFQNGECMGLFMGSIQPKTKAYSKFAITSPVLGTIDPVKGFKGADVPRYYMGVHMVNDYGFNELKDDTQHIKKKRKSGKSQFTKKKRETPKSDKFENNALIDECCLLWAKRNIYSGEEICIGYSTSKVAR